MIYPAGQRLSDRELILMFSPNVARHTLAALREKAYGT